MRRLVTIATLVLALVAAAPAAATVTAIPEPPITKGTSNTFWFAWSNVVGGNYSLCYWVSVNGGGFARPAGRTCSGNGGDTGLLTGTSGYQGIQLTGLADGSTYRVCASQKVNGVEGAFECMAPGKTPRVDNSAPYVDMLSVGGAADYTNNPQFPVLFTYADRWSSPWSDRHFGESAFYTGDPANRICVRVGAGCTATDAYRTDFAGCNVPQLHRDTTASRRLAREPVRLQSRHERRAGRRDPRLRERGRLGGDRQPRGRRRRRRSATRRSSTTPPTCAPR